MEGNVKKKNTKKCFKKMLKTQMSTGQQTQMLESVWKDI